MNTLKSNLERREKSELVAIITHMLRQETDLQWLLTTPLPTASSRKASIDPELYRQQILAAMSVGTISASANATKSSEDSLPSSLSPMSLLNMKIMLLRSPSMKCWSPRSLSTSMIIAMSMLRSV